MNHPDDDKLLQFVLQTLEESESSELREHLAQCVRCRELEQKMQADVERLTSVQVHVDIPEPPGMAGLTAPGVKRWGWAAGLAAGFLLGFSVARVSIEYQPVAVPQRLITAGAPGSPSGYVQCRPLDVKAFHIP